MKKTGCFEKSAYKIQMPGNHPKERIQHSEHVEILKSRNISIFIRETINSLGVGIGCVQIIWMCSNYLDVFKLFVWIFLGFTAWPLTTEPGVRIQSAPCKVCSGKSSTGTLLSCSTGLAELFEDVCPNCLQIPPPPPRKNPFACQGEIFRIKIVLDSSMNYYYYYYYYY